MFWRPDVYVWYLLCCLGETKTFGQFFDGSLAGLTMLNGTTETERAVKCLNTCGEKLQFHAMDMLSVGMVSAHPSPPPRYAMSSLRTL